jgi:hypothetical protein
MAIHIPALLIVLAVAVAVPLMTVTGFNKRIEKR